MSYADELFEKGWNAKLDGNYSVAVNCFEQAASMGHSDAQYKLGVCYYFGDGVPNDLSKAMFWFSKAGIQKHPQALEAVEKIFEDLPFNDLLAVVLDFRKMHQNNMLTDMHCCQYSAAVFQIGYRFLHGIDGAPQDTKTATAMILESAKLGYPKAVNFTKEILG